VRNAITGHCRKSFGAADSLTGSSREGNAAIYKQSWNGCPNPSVAYEVIRIRRREGFQIDGRLVDPAEVYPKSEAWGVDGFTFTNKEAAFAKLRQMRFEQ
jgi:hypothetical protein